MSGPTVLLLVLDAVGISTLEYLLDQCTDDVPLPNLSRLGLGRLLDSRHRARFGEWGGRTHAVALDQASASPDSVIGHREMCGVIDDRTYQLFGNGFPLAYIAALEARIGCATMFNQMGGGVEVIECNAAEHARTGRPIVYASKCDPLLQIAMDEAIISVTRQHWIADMALELALEMGIPITRVIARAYVCTGAGEYMRTANRHDAVLPLPGRTLVDVLHERGVFTVSVGKPSDLVNTPAYDQQFHLADPSEIDPALGLRFVHPKKKDTNPFTVQGVCNALARTRTSHRPAGTFVFANAVDTDSLYGHTRDVAGALRSLAEVDRVLPLMREQLRRGDLLMVTADHGMLHRPDYGYHNREPLPLLVERIGADTLGLEMHTSEGLTEVGALVAQMFGCADEFRQSIVRIPA